MYPDDSNFTGYLKFRVLSGDIDFSALVTVLSERGYITEIDFPERAGLGSSHMEALRQEEFDELFAFFYPGRLNTIELHCIATNEGGTCPTGAYAYALINKYVLSHQEGIDILERENYLGEFSEYDLALAKDDLLEFLKASAGKLHHPDVVEGLKERQERMVFIEKKLKALGVLPLTEEERISQALDKAFPHARSREEVDLDGKRYVRVFTPAQKDEEGKVIEWERSWRRLGEG